jgi:hypothetical protein
VKLALRTLVISLLLLPLLFGTSYTFWGSSAAASGALGVLLALFSIASFGLLARVIATTGKPQRGMIAATWVVWLIKLPLLWLVTAHVVSLGTVALACFLAGLALVYFCLVLTAVLGTRPSSRDPF